MSQIRVLKGKKISDKGEISAISNDALKTSSPILLGSASNVEIIKTDSYLYDVEDELYGRQRLYMPAAGMNMVNLVIGPMGSGKTNFLCNIINEFSDSNQIINDPKQEYLRWFYEKDKGDVIVGFPDQRGVIWDIFAEIAEDPQMAQLIFKNMLMSARGGNDKEGMEWVTYAIKWLMKMANIIIDKLSTGEIEYCDIAHEIVIQFDQFKLDVAASGERMQSDAIGTAEPAFSTLFQMYHIGINDERRFVIIKEIMQARRVFLINSPRFAEKLDMVNNAMMAMMINAYLSRDNVNGDLNKYTLFILDEYLTFKLDEATETNLLTLCRSKGLCVFLGMQSLPTDPQKVADLTTSRYLTVCYKVNNESTAKAISELTEEIKYQRQEMNVVVSEKGGLSPMNDMSLNETWYDVETRQVSKDMIMNLSAYTAFVEINDKKYGVVRTFIRPPLFDDTVFEPGFIYSEVARTAPNLSDFA